MEFSSMDDNDDDDDVPHPVRTLEEFDRDKMRRDQ
jgi:hypothetical protein